MPRAPASLLHAAGAAAAAPTSSSSDSEQQPAASVDSDMVVILASFLCALICVLGLALVSRCACRRFCSGRRRQQEAVSSSSSGPADPPPKGLRKKAIDALPTVAYSSGNIAAAHASGDCAICLADFGEGEALRVLPRCRHAFHVACVDAWLRTRATCPSCRAGAAAGGAAAQLAQHCGRCGSLQQVPTTSSAPAPAPAHDDTFLP